MKRVSYEIAVALKNLGYPQDAVPITEIGWYNIARVYTNQLPTYWEGDNMFVAVAPTYIDVWLWLINTKKYIFHPIYDSQNKKWISSNTFKGEWVDTVEEAIVNGIRFYIDEYEPFNELNRCELC